MYFHAIFTNTTTAITIGELTTCNFLLNTHTDNVLQGFSKSTSALITLIEMDTDNLKENGTIR